MFKCKNRLNFRNVIIIILFFFMLTSCVTEEDKHPEVPYFSEIFSEDLQIEVYDYVERFDEETDVIRDKKTKKIIKKTIINHIGYSCVATNGDVYFKEKYDWFKLTAPLFQKTLLKRKEFTEDYNNNMLAKEKEEMKRLKLAYKPGGSNEEYFAFLKKKKCDYLNGVLSFNDCKSIFIGEHINVIRYNDGSEFYVYLSEEDLKDLRQLPKKINFVYANNSSYTSADRAKYLNSNFSIKNFDSSSLLEYNTSGGNHFVPGFNGKYLYYNEITIEGKSFKCKTLGRLDKAITLNDDVLVSNNGKTYKITVK